MTSPPVPATSPTVPAPAPADGTFGDGLAMSGAAGGAALVGMVSWVVAARALPPATLGTATAFVSALLLVAGVTELNLGVGLLRWLPAAGSAARVLLVRGFAAVAGLAAVAAVVFLVLPGSAVIVDAVVGGPGGDRAGRTAGGAVFVLAAALYAVFQQQDFALVGLRRPWWAPARTALFAVGRLGILLGAGASLTTTGVVASWVVPTAACVLLGAGQAWWLTRCRDGARGVLPARREVLGLGPAYLGQAATAVLFNQVPLLVVLRFGPATGGAFFLVWQAVVVVDVVALYFTTSMAAGIARAPERAAELSRATLRRLLLLVLPGLAVGAAVAEPVLAFFGPVYAAQASVLRLMLAGLALRMLVVHRLGEHQALARGVRFARLAVVGTGLVVAVAALVPAGVADPLRVFALGFVGVQAACAFAVVLRRCTGADRAGGRS